MAAQPKPDPFPDDRLHCTQCKNLTGRGRCLAAQRGDIVASRNYEPIRDILHRCQCYVPLLTDGDQRHGAVRWSGLSKSE